MAFFDRVGACNRPPTLLLDTAVDAYFTVRRARACGAVGAHAGTGLRTCLFSPRDGDVEGVSRSPPFHTQIPTFTTPLPAVLPLSFSFSFFI